MALWHDWITSFEAYTEGITSPPLFRLWCGIAAVAGALERRIWANTARGTVYPNLFTLLVASPGVGKTEAITRVEDLWYSARKFRIAPNNVTKAALVDALARADQKIIIPSGLVEYHSLLVPASEFGVLVPAHDLEFLSVLNYVYDNPRNYREERRSLAKEIDIVHPQLNILAGSQPGFLASLLPEEAWTMGTTSRLLMIYAAAPPIVDLFDDLDEEGIQAKQAAIGRQRRALVEGLVHLAGCMGGVHWTRGAQRTLASWHKAGAPPVPDHSKLQHYVPRRTLHVIKLSMVSALSRTGEMVIHEEDVERAKDWLLGAEVVMPDIFREMLNRSDSLVIQELHLFMWRTFTAGKKPIHEAMMINFLQAKMPSEKILRLLEIAERSGIIARVAGTEKLYVPRPKHDHGLE